MAACSLVELDNEQPENDEDGEDDATGEDEDGADEPPASPEEQPPTDEMEEEQAGAEPQLMDGSGETGDRSSDLQFPRCRGQRPDTPAFLCQDGNRYSLLLLMLLPRRVHLCELEEHHRRFRNRMRV